MTALAIMRLQTITYRGRPVACATATRFFLADDLDRLPAGDPVLTFVVYMCAYAHDVPTGELAGAYTDHNTTHAASPELHSSPKSSRTPTASRTLTETPTGRRSP